MFKFERRCRLREFWGCVASSKAVNALAEAIARYEQPHDQGMQGVEKRKESRKPSHKISISRCDVSLQPLAGHISHLSE